MRRTNQLYPPLVLGLLLATGCASSGPRTVSALGFSKGIRNTSLARTAASGRAINGLHKILSESRFEWAQGEVGSRLNLSLPAEKLKYQRTQFFPLAEGGWMVQAVAEVPAAVDQRHQSLANPLETEATVTNTDISLAYLVAEARALRMLIAESLGSAVEPGIHTGKLTLTNLIVDVDQDTVTVHAVGRARITKTAALPEGASNQLLSYALRDHRIAGEWQALLDIANRELEKTPKSQEYLEIAATAHTRREEHQQAAARYAVLKTLNELTWEKFTNLQLEALKAWGTKEALAEIAEIEAEIAKREQDAEPDRGATTQI